ncbi:hypothetical protein IFM46972_10135 [Aspergillus udagawae]|uniref:Uncharacterized protein n=1 Tax=Aspergillus udagawae TaxID=91492 RepID=A0A8H3SB18_9EURO|nr:hypothetical protein IFM46972_10135 [Aspergillus udagawae]
MEDGEHFGEPGYLIALPLNVTEAVYSRGIPSAARKLRELGIDDIVEDLELSKLGHHITKRLFVGFNPLKQKTRGVTKRKEPPSPLTSVDVDEDEAATDDRIGSSISPVNANQTHKSHTTNQVERGTDFKMTILWPLLLSDHSQQVNTNLARYTTSAHLVLIGLGTVAFQ